MRLVAANISRHWLEPEAHGELDLTLTDEAITCRRDRLKSWIESERRGSGRATDDVESRVQASDLRAVEEIERFG